MKHRIPLWLYLLSRVDIFFDNLSAKLDVAKGQREGIRLVAVPRAMILSWRKEWLEQNDLHDGTDCVTPFDPFLY